MDNDNQQKITFQEEFINKDDSEIYLNKIPFLEVLNKIKNNENLNILKKEIFELKRIIHNPNLDESGFINISPNGETISFKKRCLFLIIKKLIPQLQKLY
ncbi:MAG: hypothetical protein N2560_09470 [Ignavibacteria bacterium]|nr:hypothetical protein [Ignavibacteria bacterium]